MAIVGNGRDESGKRRRKIKYAKTRGEAQEALTELLLQKDLGTLPTTNERTESLTKFLIRWLSAVVVPNRRKRTAEFYELLCKNHISPQIGSIPLTKLKASHVAELLEHKRQQGLSTTTLHHIHTALKSSLEQAVRWNVIPRNVAKLVDSVRIERKEIQPPSDEQLRMFLEAIRGDRYEALFVCAVALGLRKGELLGLRIADVDFDSGWLTVSQSVQRIAGEGLVAAPVKTRQSRRSLHLSPSTVKVLKAWRLQQTKDRLSAGPKWQETGYLFTGPTGKPLEPRAVHTAFKRLLLKAGLPKSIRLHDMRHAHSSYLLRHGIPLLTVSRMLGHSTIGTTADTYGHLTPGMLKDAAEKIDTLLEPMPTNTTKDSRSGW
jgi:integrase